MCNVETVVVHLKSPNVLLWYIVMMLISPLVLDIHILEFNYDRCSCHLRELICCEDGNVTNYSTTCNLLNLIKWILEKVTFDMIN